MLFIKKMMLFSKTDELWRRVLFGPHHQWPEGENRHRALLKEKNNLTLQLIGFDFSPREWKTARVPTNHKNRLNEQS